MRHLLPCQSQAQGDCEDRHTLPDTLRMLAPVGPGQFNQKSHRCRLQKAKHYKGENKEARKPGRGTEKIGKGIWMELSV